MRSPFSLISLVGDAEQRQAVRSAPLGDVVTDLAFQTTEAGSFTLSAEVPTGWSAVVTDREAGTSVDLAADVLSFTAQAGDWADRFTLSVAPALTTSSSAESDLSLRIGAVYPNPTVGFAHLAVEVDQTQPVTAALYDALGRRVALLFEGLLGGGPPTLLDFDTQGLAPGVYVVRVQGSTFAESRRLIVLR